MTARASTTHPTGAPSPASTTSPWLDASAVAGRIGVSERTVRGWTAAGLIPHTRLPGRLVRYRVDEVDAWLATYSVAPVRGARP